MSAIAKNIYQLGFEISPILLKNGVASQIPGNLLPIATIMQAGSMVDSLLSGNNPIELDDMRVRFSPLPGATLIQNQVGLYPFANIAVAANAIISQPLNISMLMSIPVNQTAGYINKFMTMSALKGVLDYHTNLGGTYIVATPSYVYMDCLLLGLEDSSNGDINQPQNTWRWDFMKPLVTTTDAAQAQNFLMDKLSNGSMISNPSWSGLATSIAPTLMPANIVVGGLT